LIGNIIQKVGPLIGRQIKHQLEPLTNPKYGKDPALPIFPLGIIKDKACIARPPIALINQLLPTRKDNPTNLLKRLQYAVLGLIGEDGNHLGTTHVDKVGVGWHYVG
jgi:hypothetical protein